MSSRKRKPSDYIAFEFGTRFIEIGNYVITGFVLTQILSEGKIKVDNILLGLMIIACFYFAAYLFIRRKYK